MKPKETIKRSAKTGTQSLPSQPMAKPAESSTGLPELLVDGIRGMYWAENQLVVSLPKLASAAVNPSLKKAFKDHLKVTITHVKKLEQVFELLGEMVKAKKCDAVEGLAMDGEHIIENTLPGSKARDTGLIMAGLKTENYEITSYNGLIKLAAQLGNNNVADVLSEILKDEMQADEILDALSKNDSTTPSKKSR
jgi:ferritin-like metal-binding protein YciE